MMQVRKILIADDDDDLRSALAEQLALYDEFEPVQAQCGHPADKSPLRHVGGFPRRRIGAPVILFTVLLCSPIQKVIGG